MAFVCTIDPKNVQAELFEEGSDYLVVMPIGYDEIEPFTYSLAVILSPSGGGIFEYAFRIIKFTEGELPPKDIWSGLETSSFIKGEDRRKVLAMVLICTRRLLDAVKPSDVFFCTWDANAPEKANRKNLLVAETFKTCGYKVRTADPWHGQRKWQAKRNPRGFDVSPNGGEHGSR